jgi:hypothetical protein
MVIDDLRLVSAPPVASSYLDGADLIGIGYEQRRAYIGNKPASCGLLLHGRAIEMRGRASR